MLYGRLLARHMGKHIPGQPNLVPQNMTGAGSLEAANYIYSVAPKDGTVFGTFARTLAITPLLDQGASSTAPSSPGSAASPTRSALCVTRHTSPVKTWNDFWRSRSTLGGEGTGLRSECFRACCTERVRRQDQARHRLSGHQRDQLATERGEVDGLCGLSWSTLKSRHRSWLKDKKINILVQAAIKKEAELADVPPAPI